MTFFILLSIVLFFLGAGLVYRFQDIARKSRFFEKDQDTWAKKIFDLNIKGFFLNTLFQIKLFKAGKLRWLAHFLVILGFVYLLIVHAMDGVTSGFFSWYQPGIAPFRFLRNLAGLGVGLGCVLFLLRRLPRFRTNRERVKRKKGDRFRGTASILLILALIVSGFLLEASRIISEPRFDEMVEEYSGLDEDSGQMDLEAFWVKNYHLVLKEDLSSKSIDYENAASLNQEYCLDCHDRPDEAFISTPLALGAKPFGNWLARFRVDNVFYWLHYVIGLLLLAFLPFSRMFHLIAIPVASTRKRIRPQSLKKNMGLLDLFSLTACTNCGFCSEVCNVYPNFQVTGNGEILPHLKIETVKTMAKKGLWDARTVARLRSGNDDCTRCGRCADICPSGIDLIRLWESADHLMTSLGCPDNYTQVLGTSFEQWTRQDLFPKDFGNSSLTSGLADQVAAFENCVQCTICTNSCPVVAHDLNQNDLGPHQVMNLLRLGEKHMATGSRMVWHCLTCYSCQELCPQGIRVTDILLELRTQGQKTAGQIKLSQLTNQGSDK
ncbi:MAG: 4Fe-4S dicluster domain-containing protein [Desulfobacteraceae bacterium]|nr:4Fe-4S dicluster domain-containing protein [Desulfobacteraceae bacterium]